MGPQGPGERPGLAARSLWNAAAGGPAEVSGRGCGPQNEPRRALVSGPPPRSDPTLPRLSAAGPALAQHPGHGPLPRPPGLRPQRLSHAQRSGACAPAPAPLCPPRCRPRGPPGPRSLLDVPRRCPSSHENAHRGGQLVGHGGVVLLSFPWGRKGTLQGRWHEGLTLPATSPREGQAGAHQPGQTEPLPRPPPWGPQQRPPPAQRVAARPCRLAALRMRPGNSWPLVAEQAASSL